MKTLFSICLLLASSVFGQAAPEKALERTFNFNPGDSVQAMQAIGTAVQGIAVLERITANAEQQLTVQGTLDQIALVEWLMRNIDAPAEPGDSLARKYEMTSGADRNSVVSVFYLPHTPTIQNLQEIATTVRTVGDIRRVFLYPERKAVVLRATPEQTEFVEWIFKQLDQPAEAAKAVKLEYIVAGPGDPDNVVRLFSLSPGTTMERFQEIAVQVRKTTMVRRLFT
ncbi:MAG: hypothetical protein M3Z32_08085 [Acidobacteriota bacterium]|nr:hypothetical protein [Acidobacteriota bacterium]